MVTVGYGDITPSNPNEVIFVICTILISCGVFSYSFNSIGLIVKDLNHRAHEFALEMR